MPSWFSKVFKNAVSERAADIEAPAPARSPLGLPPRDSQAAPPPRRVVHARVLVTPEERSAFSEGIRIKARFARTGQACSFLVDRPVFAGYSFVLQDRNMAHACSPLAAELFDLGNVDSVTIHEFTITVAGAPRAESEWEAYAREAGPVIREHLKEGRPVVDAGVLGRIPSEEEIRAKLQRLVDEEINPGVAAHSGEVTLNRVTGNTVYVTMGGSCQGCSMSSVTLRQGIEKAFREAVPLMGALLDETDHAAGTNPYFTDNPAEFG